MLHLEKIDFLKWADTALGVSTQSSSGAKYFFNFDYLSPMFRKINYLSKLRVWAFVFVYSLLIVYGYVNFSFIAYEYLGFQLNRNASLFSIFSIAFFSSALVLMGPKKLEQPSDLLCFLAYTLVYIPAVNVGYVSVAVPSFEYLELFSVYTVCISLIFYLRKLNFKVFRSSKISSKIYWSIFIFFILICSILVSYFYKTDLGSLFSIEDFNSLYDIRSQYRESGKDSPAIVEYMFSWLAKFFWPMVLVFGLSKGSRLIIGISFIGFLSLFVTSGHKSIFLSFFAVLGFWYLWRKMRIITIERLMLIALLVVFIGFVSELGGYPFVNNVLVRRVILVPGILSAFYYDFFSRNEYALLGYSFLKNVVDYKYTKSPPFLIGEYYFGRSEMSANANFIASGYADFGPIGAMISSIIAIIFYKILDELAMIKKSAKACTLLAVVPTWALVDSAFQTVLLTHGLILLMMAIYFSPMNSFAERENPKKRKSF
jgi:hypothetical protein